jgi:3-oxoacyl-[acyl-carrier-protein] synthase-3
MNVRLVATASYLPARWMSAADVAAASGIPEPVVVERFGLRGKHIAADDEHVSGMAARAGAAVLAAAGQDPKAVDLVVYYGSTYKDYPVWQAAPRIAELLGIDRAFALELDYVSCGAPVGLRIARDALVAEPELRCALLVGAARESSLIDFGNPRARFMFPFGDGAAAALLVRDPGGTQVLGSHAITDPVLSMQVKVPAGGSVQPASAESVAAGLHTLDVADPAAMKARLDAVSLDNFRAVAETALARSGASLADLGFCALLHMKRSMHEAVLARIGLPPERSLYLDDTGHMSGVDTLLALDRAARGGLLAPGELVLLLAAGTGYTWAATVLRWGP